MAISNPRGTDGAALATNYTAARAGYIDELGSANLPSDIDDIREDLEHTTAIFPEATNETVTFTAGGTNNTFGAWAEIVDNNAVTFSSKAASNAIHITSIQLESESLKDKIYVAEISYGASKTVIARSRFYSGDATHNTQSQIRMHTVIVPAGETIYYRLACETADATCTLSIRYHTHS